MAYPLENSNEGMRLDKQNSRYAYDINRELNFLQIEPKSTILDVGCGTGEVSSYLIKKFPDITIDACDISEVRLQSTKEKIPKENRGSFYHADIDQLIPSPQKYDHIFCRYLFEHLEDPIKKIHTLKSLLKKRGFLNIINFDGLFYNLYPCSNRLSFLLNRIRESLPFDLEVGRKLPSFLYNEGFEIKKITGETTHFFSDSLKDEIELIKTRLYFAQSIIEQHLGPSDCAEFIDLYLEEANQNNAFLFYNKFVIQATLP